MKRNYFCPCCSFIYCPTQGDRTNNVPPNTSFASLTDSWACPICNAPKSLFRGEEINTFEAETAKKAGDPQKMG